MASFKFKETKEDIGSKAAEIQSIQSLAWSIGYRRQPLGPRAIEHPDGTKVRLFNAPFSG